MKYFLRKIVFGLALVINFGMASAANNTSVSQMLEASLEAVSESSSTVVVNGTRYTYKVDTKNALYQNEDAEKLIPINKLEVGETYYFQLYSDGDKVDFKNVIFIAKEPRGQ